MLQRIEIKNFKSLVDLSLDLGRVNVFIGENGSGKSNILEAIGFAAAALSNKVENEFLASRGIRVTEPEFMAPAFAELGAFGDEKTLSLSVIDGRDFAVLLIVPENGSYAKWRLGPLSNGRFPLSDTALHVVKSVDLSPEQASAFKILFADKDEPEEHQQTAMRARLGAMYDLQLGRAPFALRDYVVFSPEASALRTFVTEGQIVPLGVRGEGLFKFLRVLSAPEHGARWSDLKENLRVLDWFDDIEIPTQLAPYEHTLRIRDRFLREDAYFDQRSSNEAFLYLLFYLALVVGPETPRVFAVDNIEASLNPKLCTELTRRIALLAAKYDKQLIVTTHNPAILDGLDLHDDAQRLFVVRRNRKGHTIATRVAPPQPVAGERPVKLSEAFLTGILGGLPQNF